MTLRTRVRSAVAGITAMLLPVWVAAGNLTPRDWAHDTITPISTLRLNNITEQIGGYNVTNNGPNFGMLITSSISTYSDAMGQIAYVIIFAIPFVMMWIVQADMTMPAIIGMLFSLYVFLKIPAQYTLFGVGCFVICFAALLWSLYKRSY